jgi:hypothetical protein
MRWERRPYGRIGAPGSVARLQYLRRGGELRGDIKLIDDRLRILSFASLRDTPYRSERGRSAVYRGATNCQRTITDAFTTISDGVIWVAAPPA